MLLRDLKKVDPETLRQAILLHLAPFHPLFPFSPLTFIAITNSPELVLGPCAHNAHSAERALSTALMNVLDPVAPLLSFFIIVTSLTLGHPPSKSSSEVS